MKLIIIDEIHLLGEDRGAVLEVIVSRMRYMGRTTGSGIRIVGLSTALANAADIADWMGVSKGGLYNFRPSVRPVPLEAHIHGFPGKHYCPRMAQMNKPCFNAILTHSPTKPTLIFVASRRQTRLTAFDMISMCMSQSKKFLHMDAEQLDLVLEYGMQVLSGDRNALPCRVKDEALRHTLAFGIGIHHAGLEKSDRIVVENLFLTGKIQVLICTATCAWGVNFPAHLVIIKGTEYFDADTGRYVPFPVTDVLQMMGRSGRPGFDGRALR